MSNRQLRSALALSVIAAAALAPLTVFAAGPFHPAPTEAGVTYHPDHANTRTRGEVVAEFNQATKHRSWNTSMSRGAPWPVSSTETPKTREQVQAELAFAMKHPAWNAVSRGASWPAGMIESK
ncbi:DUF4148 domain-containing protein [Variovorax sp. UMC13]|uniref:DUF4148 domain-containing protein n=1 Tax=Variovorax sp. UMC13 TaxID=1862326 RepID=UPI0016040D82|nr:DUF4148 domain-containing protein [Variovorax sp. UMC13]